MIMLVRVVQVHDFAQTLKECEKQIKQLETASTGKLRPKLGLDFGVLVVGISNQGTLLLTIIPFCCSCL